MSQLVFKRSFRQINVTYGGFTKRAYSEYAKEHGLKKATKAAEAARLSSYEESQRRLAAQDKAKAKGRGKTAGAKGSTGTGDKVCYRTGSGKMACFVPRGGKKAKTKTKAKARGRR